MKHTGSCLPDCGFVIEVDVHRRHVVANSDSFDSALFARLVIINPLKSEIRCEPAV